MISRPILSVNNLSLTDSERTLFKDISFELFQGESFETQLATYLKQRQEILNRDFLGQDEKEAEIIALRKQSFDAAQWRRIEALERIHDRQN